MARSDEADLRIEGVQPVQVLAGIMALAFVITSGLGFVRSGTSADQVLGLTLNPLRLFVYFAAGALGLIVATVSATARAYGWLLFAGGGLAFVWGMMLNGRMGGNPVSWLGNPLALGISDSGWHLAVAVVGLPIAVLPARKVLREPYAERPRAREAKSVTGSFSGQYPVNIDIRRRQAGRR